MNDADTIRRLRDTSSRYLNEIEKLKTALRSIDNLLSNASQGRIVEARKIAIAALERKSE